MSSPHTHLQTPVNCPELSWDVEDPGLSPFTAIFPHLRQMPGILSCRISVPFSVPMNTYLCKVEYHQQVTLKTESLYPFTWDVVKKHKRDLHLGQIFHFRQVP